MKLGRVEPIDWYHYIRPRNPVVISGVKTLIGYPIVVNSNCGVFDPAAQFIRHLAMWKSQSIGSLVDVAGIICNWCNYLSSRGLSWEEARSDIFNIWLTNDYVEKITAKSRQTRKASVIFRWYRFLALERGVSSVSGFAKSISDSPIIEGEIGRKMRFRSSTGPRLKNGRRPVPSSEDADKVLIALMSHPKSFISERNWLVGRVEYETGLRAMGNASLDIKFIDQLLISKSITNSATSTGHMTDRLEQIEIRRRINHLSSCGFERLYGKITEKRNKSRSVGFPLTLVLSILDYIWGERAKLLRDRFRPSAAGYGPLWISATTGGALSRGAICDIVAIDGFKAAGIAGSGHSLRAAFLTEAALRLLGEARVKFGQNYDEFTILNELAELAGHDDPSTLRHYLDQARLREFVLGAHAALR